MEIVEKEGRIMNEELNLKLFENNEFGSIRILILDGEYWFVAKDVSVALGYSETNAMTRRLDSEDVMSDKLTGMNMKSILINESGLYSAIMGSNLPNAKKFKRWVTSEVLPSIRKTGNYISDKERLQLQLFSDDKMQVANAHKMLIEMEKAPLIAKIEEQVPKVAFANAIGNSETLIYISELGKILKQNGVDIGEKRLFEWLRDNGYLIKRQGQARNLPTQRSIELGIFKLIEKPYVKPSGERVISRTAMVTPKGQEYFLNKFLIPVVKGA